MNQSSNRTLGEGWTALFLFVLVVAVWLFPIPVVIYCAYMSLFFGVIDRMRPRLLVLLATWPRVILTGVVSLGIFGIFLVSGDIDLHKLHPHTFSSVTLLMVGSWLLWLVVHALRRLWKRRKQP